MPPLSLSIPEQNLLETNLGVLAKQAKIKIPGIDAPVVVDTKSSIDSQPLPTIPNLVPTLYAAQLGAQTASGATGTGAVPATGIPGGIGISNDIPIPPTSKIGQSVVRAALQFRGIPYVWGGEDPNTGFDCSGLMQYVFHKYGVNIPRVTYDQFRSGTPVPVKAMRPGDLVFFHMGSQGPGHVGIFIGNGKFLHAPQTGDVVKISDLDLSHVVGIRRFG